LSVKSNGDYYRQLCDDEATEVAGRLTEFMNDALLRLRPRTSVAEPA